VPRFFPGSTITLRNYVRVDETLTDASAITFMWKMGTRGTENTVTPTRASTGSYYVEITPEEGGDLYYRWDTEGDLDAAREGKLSIADTQFTI
jgi:hypothetical protein